MELRFVPPSLVALDELATEVLACSLWSDVLPAHGLAGLCDWRLAGRISSLVRRRYVTGAVGEVVMVPGKPRLSFDKLLFFGAGDRAAFSEESFRALVRAMLGTLEGLAARAAVVELPGRHDELIAAERAADILLTASGGKREHDVWTLVENAEGKQRITQHMIEERRRIRRVL